MSLAGIILQGMQAGAASQGRALDDAMAMHSMRENQARYEAALAMQEQEQQQATLQESAARRFWQSRLAPLIGPAQMPGMHGMGAPGGARPEAPVGIRRPDLVPPGAEAGTNPPAFDPVTSMIDDPNLPSEDIRRAYGYTLDLHKQEQEQARQQAERANFDRWVDQYAVSLEKEGYKPEAEKLRAEARATGKWPSWVDKPLGIVEPGTFQNLMSDDPALRAQGAATYMERTGKPPPAGLMPLRERPKHLPSQRAVDAVARIWGEDTAAVYADTGKFIRPPGNENIPDPEERLATFQGIVSGYGGDNAFNPGGLAALQDKFVSGKWPTEGDWKRALIDKTASRNGEKTAAKVVYDDFQRQLSAARQEFAAAKRTTRDKKKLAPFETRVKELEAQKGKALDEYIKRLRAADEEQAEAPEADPAAPAAGPAQGPATPDEIAWARQSGAKSPEQAAEMIRQRRQQR
jgi:hypothetical protein